MGAGSSGLLLGLWRRGGGKERQAVATGNTPDVIEAHERYGRAERLEQPTPAPGPHARPSLLYTYSAPRSRTEPADPEGRKLPTQHQHPIKSAEQDETEVGAASSDPVEAFPTRQQQRHSRHHRSCCTTPTSSRTHSRTRARTCRRRPNREGGFGYDIQDVDGFLAKASLESPANIPMVLSRASILYRTREGGWQEEVPLPLGMVVNGVFLVARWLYAQTPHGQEGYVSYTACIPLGILPGVRSRPGPCWDTASDVFPAPSGNRTDTDKIGSESERSYDAEGERRLDALFLRATSSATSNRQSSEGYSKKCISYSYRYFLAFLF